MLQISHLKEAEQLNGYPEERWPRGMTPAVWRIPDHLFLADGLSDLTRHGVFYRFSSAQARESKSKPEAAVLITTTLCPHSTVRRAWLTEPRGPAVVSTGHQRCAVLWALGFPPCWISQPIALDKVWAYLFINFYIRQ